MSDISTREYEARDWPEVSKIHDLARPIELEGSCDPKAFVRLADDKNDLQEFLNSRKLVACYETRIVGFIGIDASTLTRKKQVRALVTTLSVKRLFGSSRSQVFLSLMVT